jgi:hypothetical protein
MTESNNCIAEERMNRLWFAVMPFIGLILGSSVTVAKKVMVGGWEDPGVNCAGEKGGC